MTIKLQNITKLFQIFSLRWRTRYLERTTKSRALLRHQYTEYKGKDILVMDYIRIVAKMMPPMLHNNHSVDHLFELRRIYYKYDLKGLKYYIQNINKKMKVTGKEFYEQRKLKRKELN